MGPMNYIMMAITVLLIIEAVVEARRKRWLALALSIAFLALVIYMNSPAYRYLWRKIAPPTAAQGKP